jgi:hypothetical protein
MVQSVETRISYQVHRSAATAIAPGWTAARHELLAPEGNAAVATAPTLNVERSFVEEDQLCRMPGATERNVSCLAER